MIILIHLLHKIKAHVYLFDWACTASEYFVLESVLNSFNP